MSVKDKAMAAGEAMMQARTPQPQAVPPTPSIPGGEPNRIPVEGPLPTEMPFAAFLKANPTLSDREALSPGITGSAAYRNITTNPQGVMVKITGTPTHVTPGVADYAIADMKAKQQAQMQVDPNAGPSMKTAPLTEMLRTYGPAVVASMYPGIFGYNGHAPYMKRFGTNDSGELLVPSYGNMNPAPLTQPVPVDAKPGPPATLLPPGSV